MVRAFVPMPPQNNIIHAGFRLRLVSVASDRNLLTSAAVQAVRRETSHMKKIIVAAALLALGATAAFAGPIEDRQAAMKAIAGASRDANNAAKATPYDAATVKAKLQVIADNAD